MARQCGNAAMLRTSKIDNDPECPQLIFASGIHTSRGERCSGSSRLSSSGMRNMDLPSHLSLAATRPHFERNTVLDHTKCKGHCSNWTVPGLIRPDVHHSIPAAFSLSPLRQPWNLSLNYKAWPFITSVEEINQYSQDIAKPMHHLSSFALASVFAVRVGVLSFRYSEMLESWSLYINRFLPLQFSPGPHNLPPQGGNISSASSEFSIVIRCA